MQYDLLIFAALDREVSELARSLERVLVDGPFALWAGSVEARSVLLVRTGIGPAAAARAAERVFSRAHAAAALVVGTCGALAEDLAPGDAVIASEVLDAETGERFLAAPELLALAEGTPLPGVLRRGVLASVAEVVATPAEKRALGARTQADIVDQESATLARACALAGVPFLAVRAVLDPAHEGLPSHPDGPLMDDAGKPQWSRLLAVAARDPTLPVGLTRLWRRERAARATLEAFLRMLFAEDRSVAGRRTAS